MWVGGGVEEENNEQKQTRKEQKGKNVKKELYSLKNQESMRL